MPSRRFRTRQQWSNTTLWALVALAIVLVSVTGTGMTGKLIFVEVALIIAAAGFFVAVPADRPRGISYGLDGDTLVLKRRSVTERIPLQAINDSSLVDRRAARDLLNDRLRLAQEKGANAKELADMREAFVHWCTVDIGLRSYTFGIGRDLIDKRPTGKQDLVMLRLADGRVIVLSPVYNQDLVESLHRTTRK
jgi:hypothetical protein